MQLTSREFMEKNTTYEYEVCVWSQNNMQLFTPNENAI